MNLKKLPDFSNFRQIPALFLALMRYFDIIRQYQK